MSQPSDSDESSSKRGPDEAFCRDCGAVIDAEAEICPECGVRQRDPPQSSLDRTLEAVAEGGNPFVAGALSALVPGLGQLYNRELKRALIFLIAGVAAGFSVIFAVGIVLYPLVWVYAIYDAYRRADLRAEELRGEAARADSVDSVDDSTDSAEF
jgi:TM2 domain-containing membrane protein YozV/ribosomal protein L40E